MAQFVTEEEVVSLQDGKEITLRPLTISRLKRFMKAWEGFKEVEDEFGNLDVMITCSGICIEENFKADFPVGRGHELPEEYKDYLENVLDQDTIYHILDKCAGMKLNDPKLLEEAAAMARAAEETGAN